MRITYVYHCSNLCGLKEIVVTTYGAIKQNPSNLIIALVGEHEAPK